MTSIKFEQLLTETCEALTKSAQERLYSDAKAFELAVRQDIEERCKAVFDFAVELRPSAQGFPDIAIGEFGVEVKFTLQDTWKSIANSVLETQRKPQVEYLYVVFGKMGGLPEVKWATWENAVVHVRTSHVPRFEVDLSANKRESLFRQMGVGYEAFRLLPMQEKMKFIRTYARKIHPDGRLWWLDTDHTTTIQPRLYTSLSAEEKLRLRAEAALLCPQIVKHSRSKHKYDDVVLYMLTYHGVLCHQARDLFSAGSVANPSNDDEGGLYIQRALQLLEHEMMQAALEMDDALFVEYWGESVPPHDRIRKWLEKADAIATLWRPSQILFQSQ